MRHWTLAIATALLVACASIGSQHRMTQFDDLTRAYAKAIEWSEFEKAYALAADPAAMPRLDPAAYQEIKVTSYDPTKPRVSDEGRTIKRTVRIRYVHISRMVERSLSVEEEWAHSETHNRWLLRGGFPRFN